MWASDSSPFFKENTALNRAPSAGTRKEGLVQKPIHREPPASPEDADARLKGQVETRKAPLSTVLKIRSGGLEMMTTSKLITI